GPIRTVSPATELENVFGATGQENAQHAVDRGNPSEMFAQHAVVPESALYARVMANATGV
ncbi:MAG: hypothetical protein U9R75_05350, partial [Candidatus Thermoplasmatota archaeon]|nr:hypothetical protein [Candidatus Thermoplasmatota archaeon]